MGIRGRIESAKINAWKRKAKLKMTLEEKIRCTGGDLNRNQKCSLKRFGFQQVAMIRRALWLMIPA